MNRMKIALPAFRFGAAQRLSMCFVIVVATCGVSGCATPAGSKAEEPRTASDQTDADRRASVRMEMAAAYFSRGQFNTALDDVKLALSLKPDLREAVNLRGLIYAAMGETKLAEDSFKRALQLYPRDPDTLHNFGWLLCQEQRWAEADVQFDLALAQASYRAPSRTLMAKGICEARAGRMAEAERSLAKAFEYDPASPAVAVNFAEVLYRNGQYVRAQFYIKRVNAQPEFSNSQSVWLALRIERRLGNTKSVDELSQALRNKYPDSPERLALDDGRFDE
ncbi:type IV pilus biogenesis/stability protein PilW [Paucibacter sp. B2R-40]|uniref:type IV pilus biogenesis/stability protein PilW n=1 Tax=Paucibacter sp. B2R-40 TaxID=2893554 RepID=UPI0021E47D48|nr:type IV pilus biogenesis/stability protein PilW [Paucibacter sp. B2R-40]MCV2355157.1 type IV pilus biogenesis/stability protein PilW [Paucibacter sp. B2R-40]